MLREAIVQLEQNIVAVNRMSNSSCAATVKLMLFGNLSVQLGIQAVVRGIYRFPRINPVNLFYIIAHNVNDDWLVVFCTALPCSIPSPSRSIR